MAACNKPVFNSYNLLNLSQEQSVFNIISFISVPIEVNCSLHRTFRMNINVKKFFSQKII